MKSSIRAPFLANFCENVLVSILLTGGAGYIGLHIANELIGSHKKVIILDDESTGRSSLIPDGIYFQKGNILDFNLVVDLLNQYEVETIVHLAGKKSVEESFKYPALYESINVLGTKTVLDAAQKSKVKNFVFSSSAAVYGNPRIPAVSELVKPNPISPYGESKLKAERLIVESLAGSNIRFTCLRYFNVAGAAKERFKDNSVNNLIPIVVQDILLGKTPTIYGTDYPTFDGSCIRDYVHVADVARAHSATIDALSQIRLPHIMNIGTGKGASVKEIISSASEIFGIKVTPISGERRIGDPAILIAENDLMVKYLDLELKLTVKDILKSLI